MPRLTNDWSVAITEGDKVILDEKVDNASRDEERAFKARVAHHVISPKDDACTQDASNGDTLGHLSWHGGPTAGRSWTLFRCKACGGIHGRLSMIA